MMNIFLQAALSALFALSFNDGPVPGVAGQAAFFDGFDSRIVIPAGSESQRLASAGLQSRHPYCLGRTLADPLAPRDRYLARRDQRLALTLIPLLSDMVFDVFPAVIRPLDGRQF